MNPPDPMIKTARWGIIDRSEIATAQWMIAEGRHEPVSAHTAAEGFA